MRQVILDTETTGLEWRKGNRVVEIGCVELLERRPTGRTFHYYLNPERDFEPGAQEVFIAFIDGAELVIHNAAFDIGFLDAELARLDGYGKVLDRCTVEDTLLMARKRYPGQRNSLDALCKRLGVDNSQRQLHGALLDAQILLDVYLTLTSGQGEIGFQGSETATPSAAVAVDLQVTDAASRPRVHIQPDEAQAHAERLAGLQKKSGKCVWLELDAAT